MWHRTRATRGHARFSFVLAVVAVSVVLAVPVEATASSRFDASLVSPSLVPQPPKFRGEQVATAFSTRAQVEVELEVPGAEGHWTAAYSESESGPWTPAGEGAFPAGNGIIFLSAGSADASTGGGEGTRFRVIHHLSPETHYYVRFQATTAGGTAQKIVPFATTAIARPEIDKLTVDGHSTFEDRDPKTRPTPNSHSVVAELEADGADTEYHFEYSTSQSGPWTPFTTGGSGTVTAAEDYAELEATATGLQPETSYYARLKASNARGTTSELLQFTTETAKPQVSPPEFHNVTANSVRAEQNFRTGSSETNWRFESASSPSGPWTAVPGGEGTVPQQEAEALSQLQAGAVVEASLTELQPNTMYYVRFSASNVAGERVSEPTSFETEGTPGQLATSPTHGLRAESVRLMGSLNPNSRPSEAEQTITISGAPTSGTFRLTFEGQTTRPIPSDAFGAVGEGSVAGALYSLPNPPPAEVAGPMGGPYRVRFVSATAEPQITADGSELKPFGGVTVATVQEGGESYATQAHFEYVTKDQFERAGFTEATSSPNVTIPAGNTTQFVGQDVPDLASGQAYRYRLVAENDSPGNPVARGEVQTVTVPVPAPAHEAACPNGQYRTGPSASLPDCRAYEQLTPADKAGAQEPFNYGPTAVSGALIGEDGENLMLYDPVVNWGEGPKAGQSPYFFSREAGHGWAMTAGSPQPETGVQRVVPEILTPNLGRYAFEADVHTAIGGGESSEVQYKVGPPGGPYTVAATVPRADLSGAAGFDEGWVASSDDGSKLILQVEDHKLLDPEHSTGTFAGNDLYEYMSSGLAQVNAGIGHCGAHIARGAGELHGITSSAHAVSTDGSRVFFEAVPGSNCSLASHLYMRDAAETLDIGEYTFDAASPDGSTLLLDRPHGGVSEYFIYETATRTAKYISSQPPGAASVGQDFTAIYFHQDDGNLVRYDVEHESVTDILRYHEVTISNAPRTSPDGRFYYFQGTVEGLPGHEQMFLYDASEKQVECVSCASSSDSEPKLAAVIPTTESPLGPLQQHDGHPNQWFLSSDGNYAFFDTPAALVPGDGNGEVAPTAEAGAELQSAEFSPSSDVYEWRRDGIDGCAQIQGCLALITSGGGGYLNLLLGATPSGSDVFIYTRSELLAQDNDNSGDIYDVRTDGGLPGPPPRPVECEPSQCSHPAPAPNDATPSSSTFQGAGNLPSAAVATPAPPPAKPPKCARGKVASHGHCLPVCPKKKKKAHVKCVTLRRSSGSHARKSSPHSRRASTNRRPGR